MSIDWKAGLSLAEYINLRNSGKLESAERPKSCGRCRGVAVCGRTGATVGILRKEMYQQIFPFSGGNAVIAAIQSHASRRLPCRGVATRQG